MKLVYIAGPYRAKNAWEVEQNIRRAEEVGFDVARMGHVPVIPHTMFRFFDGTQTDEFWLDGTLELMLRCNGVLLCPGWERSTGARAEARKAIEVGLPVFRHIDHVGKWVDASDKVKMILGSSEVW